MRLLLAEDDKNIAAFISKGLMEEGYAVDVAYDGQYALSLLRAVDFDMIVLDVMLPVLDGIEVCKALRREGIRTPVLMLTARGQTGDRVRGLDSGADDYMVKPFAFAELLARLRALGRRSSTGPAAAVMQVGDLTLDTVTREVRRDGRPVGLTTKEFALLEHLMRHHGHVLTRTSIAEHVWNYDFEYATNVIDVHIRNLRRKIDDLHTVKLLQTVRGAGYRIVPPQTG
jgi:DNA-binding response OmpR family regulator